MTISFKVSFTFVVCEVCAHCVEAVQGSRFYVWIPLSYHNFLVVNEMPSHLYSRRQHRFLLDKYFSNYIKWYRFFICCPLNSDLALLTYAFSGVCFRVRVKQ